MMKPLHIHTRAQNHPDKQKSRSMSRIGGCSPALAAIILRDASNRKIREYW